MIIANLTHISSLSVRFLYQQVTQKQNMHPHEQVSTGVHREITQWLHHLTLPLELLIDTATILFSRVIDSCGSQLPLTRLHEETELVSGWRLLLTSVKLNFSIQHKKYNFRHIFYYIKNPNTIFSMSLKFLRNFLCYLPITLFSSLPCYLQSMYPDIIGQINLYVMFILYFSVLSWSMGHYI
jgi:hypothetical protein